MYGKLWIEASMIAGEIAITTILFAFLGYVLGNSIGKPFDFIGMCLGAFFGFVIIIYRIVKRFD